jgi:hypothetical protein
MGRWAAKYAEADPAGDALVSWRQLAPVTSLFAVYVAPARLDIREGWVPGRRLTRLAKTRGEFIRFYI